MLVTIAASIYMQCLITLHRSNHMSRLGLDRFEISHLGFTPGVPRYHTT